VHILNELRAVYARILAAANNDQLRSHWSDRELVYQPDPRGGRANSDRPISGKSA